jgi:hypothetical protein
MRPALQRVGRAQTPVITIDHFCADVAPIVAMAAALAPFPPATNHYPGLRRIITPHDQANAYIETVLETAAPFIAGAYDIDAFDLVEASFSMVTCPPAQLGTVQRAPHFDSTVPRYFAVMHYLCDTPGTAFYRHKATDIETVSEANLPQFLASARIENAHTSAGYIVGSNAFYDQIGTVAGTANRLVIYPGNLLHSGIIPGDAALSEDPCLGRLTTNIFIRG